MKKIITSLKQQIKLSTRHADDPDDSSWNYQIGVILTANEAQKVVNALTKNKTSLMRKILKRCTIMDFPFYPQRGTCLEVDNLTDKELKFLKELNP